MLLLSKRRSQHPNIFKYKKYLKGHTGYRVHKLVLGFNKKKLTFCCYNTKRHHQTFT